MVLTFYCCSRTNKAVNYYLHGYQSVETEAAFDLDQGETDLYYKLYSTP